MKTLKFGIRRWLSKPAPSMKGRTTYWRNIAALVLVVLGMIAATSAVFAENPNSGILPLGSTPYGKSYGEWSAAQWQ
ncbi:MAG: hypothetical protein HY868_03280 [Chloroflexi bacterium]|nr:hypothetical protein [Chloroflexota bacterium]